MSPLIITLKTAAVATLITFCAGILIAYFVCNLKRGKNLLDAINSFVYLQFPTDKIIFLRD